EGGLDNKVGAEDNKEAYKKSGNVKALKYIKESTLDTLISNYFKVVTLGLRNKESRRKIKRGSSDGEALTGSSDGEALIESSNGENIPSGSPELFRESSKIGSK
ncbi:hypothetical protein H100_00001, partial [Trichophyton rubrum MR850]